MFSLTYDDAGRRHVAGGGPGVPDRRRRGRRRRSVIVWRLRRLFESFTSGEPFRRENADHLRVIWITMLVIEVARYVLLALTIGLLIAAFGSTPTRTATFRFDSRSRRPGGRSSS